jgi:branched-chain amino acid aminotransferase
MLQAKWTVKDRWEAPVIGPYGQISVPTTVSCLHYGISCFDNFIVTKNKKTEKPQAFLMEAHMERLNRACKHLDLQEINPDEMKKAMKQLIALEEGWLKSGDDIPMIRLQHISTDAALGVKTAFASLLTCFITTHIHETRKSFTHKSSDDEVLSNTSNT